MVRAIARRERIVVFGDYDVDGLTATAILQNAIRIDGGNVVWSIPHRPLDGYGLREERGGRLSGRRPVLSVSGVSQD